VALVLRTLSHVRPMTGGILLVRSDSLVNQEVVGSGYLSQVMVGKSSAGTAPRASSMVRLISAGSLSVWSMRSNSGLWIASMMALPAPERAMSTPRCR
jgi:hypothetical protein